MDLELLKAPFHSSKIHWRVGATNVKPDGSLAWGDYGQGIPLAYLTSRDVMDRLDEVCGPTNWQTEHYELKGVMMCRLMIRIDGEWIAKTDGAGDTQVDPEKGGVSGATKRAAVSWGVGRYLYGNDMGWWPLEVSKNGQIKKRFSAETMTKLSKEYEKWLICEEGPIPSLVERQRTLSEHLGSVQVVKEGIASGDLSTASEEWYSLPEKVQSDLFFAPTWGGIFTTQEIAVMRSQEFREAYYGTDEAA